MRSLARPPPLPTTGPPTLKPQLGQAKHDLKKARSAADQTNNNRRPSPAALDALSANVGCDISTIKSSSHQGTTTPRSYSTDEYRRRRAVPPRDPSALAIAVWSPEASVHDIQSESSAPRCTLWHFLAPRTLRAVKKTDTHVSRRSACGRTSTRVSLSVFGESERLAGRHVRLSRA